MIGQSLAVIVQTAAPERVSDIDALCSGLKASGADRGLLIAVSRKPVSPGPRR